MPTYTLFLTSTVTNSLKKLDSRYLAALDQAFERLAKNPKLGKPLKGSLKGVWRLRFSRYQILYTIEEYKLTIIVIDISHRKDVYRYPNALY